MVTTPNMGLSAWDQSADPYQHSQLAANFTTLDNHDHTSGSGVQIPTAGIEDLAITTAKLANGSVTTAKIADAAITAAKLAPGTTANIGDVKLWWRPNTGVAVPTGWVIPIGQTLAPAAHDFAGGGTIVLPDMRNSFPLFADISGTGTGIGAPPAIGYQGGSHSLNLQHSHAVSGHTHSVPSHYHTIPSHDHTFSATTGQGGVPNNWVKVDNTSTASAHTSNVLAGGHTHPLSGETDSSALRTDDTSATSGSATSSTDTQLGATVDIRPRFTGLLPLMKVKF